MKKMLDFFKEKKTDSRFKKAGHGNEISLQCLIIEDALYIRS